MPRAAVRGTAQLQHRARTLASTLAEAPPPELTHARAAHELARRVRLASSHTTIPDESLACDGARQGPAAALTTQRRTHTRASRVPTCSDADADGRDGHDAPEHGASNARLPASAAGLPATAPTWRFLHADGRRADDRAGDVRPRGGLCCAGGTRRTGRAARRQHVRRATVGSCGDASAAGPTSDRDERRQSACGAGCRAPQHRDGHPGQRCTAARGRRAVRARAVGGPPTQVFGHSDR